MHTFKEMASKQARATLVGGNTLREFVDATMDVAGTEKMVRLFETGRSNEYLHTDGSVKLTYVSPRFRGDAGEIFAEFFLKTFGAKFDILFSNSLSDDDDEVAEKDQGIDFLAVSTTNKRVGNANTVAGTRCFGQVKFTDDFKKVHFTNDGSRITNFSSHASFRANHEGISDSARFFLFLFGAGIGHELANATFGRFEVINSKMMAELVDGNDWFWNGFGEYLGVDTFNTTGFDGTPAKDMEFEKFTALQQEIKDTKEAIKKMKKLNKGNA